MKISETCDCLGSIFFECINLICKDGEGYRTGYHFQPPKNWINDPNGPMYYNGIYHIFYQYNPKGAKWGNIVWAHSVSTNLIDWSPLDHALIPENSFDINGCFSGSTTIHPDKGPVILYTGFDAQNRQVTNMAVPKDLLDPLLKEWTKSDRNPLMLPPNGIKDDWFRDPTTAWTRGEDGYWRVLVGSGRDREGLAFLYKSEDFITWTKAENPFYSEPGIGILECLDFFPVSLEGKEGLDTSESGEGIKHVLKASLGNGNTWPILSEYYLVGQYDSDNDQYLPNHTFAGESNRTRFDHGKFYASKTFFDEAKKRRILWGWVEESDDAAALARGWAGILSVPRTLWLDRNGKQLLQWPVEELETLRTSEVQLTNQFLAKGSRFEVQGITAAQADVDVTFYVPNLENAEPFDPTWNVEQLCRLKDATADGGIGPFGLLTMASSNLANLEEYTAVFFRVFKAKDDKHVVFMCSGGIKSSLKPKLDKPSYGGFVDVDLSDGKLSLRSLIDNSVVESFGLGGKICITSRVYPTLAVKEKAHLYAFNNGTENVEIEKLKAWTMQSPRMNIESMDNAESSNGQDRD